VPRSVSGLHLDTFFFLGLWDGAIAAVERRKRGEEKEMHLDKEPESWRGRMGLGFGRLKFGRFCVLCFSMEFGPDLEIPMLGHLTKLLAAPGIRGLFNWLDIIILVLW